MPKQQTSFTPPILYDITWKEDNTQQRITQTLTLVFKGISQRMTDNLTINDSKLSGKNIHSIKDIINEISNREGKP